MTVQVEAQNLTLSIRGHQILRGVDLKIMTGETVGIVGPNGCGKTTFFNTINGFVSASSGEVFLAGQRITHLQPFERAKLGLGRVFQSFGVFRDITVGENMLMALENRHRSWRSLLPWSGIHRKFCEEARSLLKEVNLEGKFNDLAGSLSGGQQRLLEIIRAKAFGANTLLLDEPTAGVSPRMKEDVSRLIVALQAEGKTVLVIEHDIAFIQSFCKRVVVFNEGRVILDGVPEQVRQSQALREIYFGAGVGSH
jgi:ABC-type branched-subunit amino acid transport system ATPase component